ncbi:MAG: LlaJI family restriction endonuclease [Bacteroidales bacterium]|nr:LlaJI family restriction endonuclease [Bacteroidales bacterium]
MKLYFEEYSYPADLLLKNLGNDINLSYNQGGGMAKVPYVGYYFNAEINDMVFIMPKVFVSENNKAFDRYEPEKIIDLSPENNPLKGKADDEVVFELSAWLYQAINHYFERKQQSNIGSDIQLQRVRPIGEKDSKTIIEIILSLLEFQKKHHNLFTYMSLIKSSGNNKVHWAKTISREQPLFKDGMPYYLNFRNKNKVINFDEELISLFYSVLNFLSLTYHFKFQLVQGYTFSKPSKIKSLIESRKGTRLLKKIRRNYFTDELVELWNLLYMFFNRAENIASGKARSEKLLVSNFNLIFEDMIDQLISDKRDEVPKELREQPDGKIVDHIYKAQSIIEDNQQIYYIGDSKYYKETTDLGKNSIFKQFTYAKNVIQYNINLFNNKDDVGDCRYRDPLTEGYNITPNFFIRGVIDFENPRNQEQKLIKDSTFQKENKHFFNRLFDRDTLFLQSYNMSFMFVVAAYVRNTDDVALKKSIQSMFRQDFIDFIDNKFDFSILEARNGNLLESVERNFKKLNGKIYHPSDNSNIVILALDKDEKYQFENLRILSEIEDDFLIYEYHLGTNPDEVKRLVQYHYLKTSGSMVAESNESSYGGKTNRQYEKYQKSQQNTILFGVYVNKEHLDWILNNKKYNVRLGARVGAVKRTQQVTSAKYLVLYDSSSENTYKVFNLSDKHYIWNAEKMREMKYYKNFTENDQYYIYDILNETDELGEIDVASVLKRVKENAKEEIAKGTPIYVYKDEINTINA